MIYPALRPCLGFVKEEHVVAAGQLGQVGLGQLERLHSAVMPKFHLDSGIYTVQFNNFPPKGISNYLTNHGNLPLFPKQTEIKLELGLVLQPRNSKI